MRTTKLIPHEQEATLHIEMVETTEQHNQLNKQIQIQIKT